MGQNWHCEIARDCRVSIKNFGFWNSVHYYLNSKWYEWINFTNEYMSLYKMTHIFMFQLIPIDFETVETTILKIFLNGFEAQ